MDKMNSWGYEERLRPTTFRYGNWREYSEKLQGHSIGYFYMRDDGLRFGWRKAGRYYRPDATPERVNNSYTQWGQNHDVLSFDILGAGRERGKQESLPFHIRVMRDGKELELITEIDGFSVKQFYDDENFNAFAFMDKRYPPADAPPRTKSVTSDSVYEG